MKQINGDRLKGRGEAVNILLLCAAGVILDLVSAMASTALGMPVYFNTAGTVLAAALGGYVPGVLTGFFSNLLLSLTDSMQLYYGIVNILTGICAAWFARRGSYRRFASALGTVPVIAVVTGTLGAGLTWFLNNSDIGGQFADVAIQMSESPWIGRPAAQFLSELLYELLDKLFSVLLTFLLLRLIPQAFQESLRRGGRWQAPLSGEMKTAVNRERVRGVSLRARLILMLTAGMACLTATACVIGLRLFKESTVKEYGHMARLITSIIAGQLEEQPVEDFIALGRSAEGYEEFEQSLYKLKDSYPDMEYLYVYQIEKDGCHVVFDLDTASTEASEPGTVVPFDETFEPYIPALLRGEPIDPVVSDDSFGWLLTVYHPVRGANRQTVCYVGVDYSMDMMSMIGGVFLGKFISLILSVLTVVLALAMKLTERNLILPVKSMSYCAGAFAYDSEEAREENVAQLRALDIRTGDEIENLYHAFLKTTEDSMEYVDNLIHARLQVAEMKEQVSAMDKIAYKDALTGLRNKAAYDEFITRLDGEIVKGIAAFGIAMIDLNFLKRVNDTYGHEHGNDYLKACCRMVCEVFNHSPVFRVGGDEFVAILEHGDLAARDELVASLKSQMRRCVEDETLQPWEKPSAAVGIALYDAALDRNADDVFKRADAAMYADKQAMKAVRTD
ncbi:MAG: diguanylate cyclase [Oscillospiraceae bacterium]|nr:diguanylate cyclase [Oscillospiraceae bacterium]